MKGCIAFRCVNRVWARSRGNNREHDSSFGWSTREMCCVVWGLGERQQERASHVFPRWPALVRPEAFRGLRGAGRR